MSVVSKGIAPYECPVPSISIHVTVSLESVDLGSIMGIDPINTRSGILFEEGLARGDSGMPVRIWEWRSVLFYNDRKPTNNFIIERSKRTVEES